MKFEERSSISQMLSGKLVLAEISQTLTDESEILQSLTANSASGRIAQSMAGQLARSMKTQSVTGRLKALGKGQSPIGQSSPSRAFTLSWTHYVFLLGIKNPEERRFYEVESAAQDWIVRELKRQSKDTPRNAPV